MVRFSLDGPPEPLKSPDFQRKEVRNAKSCRLICSNPDGRLIHSLLKKNGIFYIETERYPLGEVTEGLPLSIQSQLPESVQEALRLDEPIELLCVDFDWKPPKENEGQVAHLPRLCLYTQKAVFVLNHSYKASNISPESSVSGTLAAKQPFERTLLEGSYSTEIIRVRCPPNKYDSASLICPAGCLAMFTCDRETLEYKLSLLQPDKGVTTPLTFGVEYLMEGDTFVDFCFGQSRDLSMLSSMAVFFLKSSGDISFATPILFNKSVIAKSALKETLDFLADKLKSIDDLNDPRYRQLRAAERYIIDIFPTTKGAYATLDWKEELLQWPPKLQGPVLFETEPETIQAFSIEACRRLDYVGLAVGRSACVDLSLVSPEILVPRYTFEPIPDSSALDDNVPFHGAKIERVELAEDHGEVKTEKVTIKVDPHSDTQFHYATRSSVCCVSSNALEVACANVKGRTAPPAKTTAWAVATSQNETISGIAVSSYQVQEVLVRAEEGITIPYSISEGRIESEIQLLSQQQQPKLLLPGTSGKSSFLDSKRFIEEAQPLVTKIQTGRSELTNFVGSETKYKDLKPSMLETAVAIRDQCDNEIVLPLLELKTLIKNRKKYLTEVLGSQIASVAKLKKMLAEMKDRADFLGEKVDVLESNAHDLQIRTDEATKASTGFTPTISKAEREYLRFLERRAIQVKAWKERAETLKEKVDELNSKIKTRDITFQEQDALSKAAPGINAVLDQSDRALRDAETRLKEIERQMNLEIRESGLDSENVSSNLPLLK